MPTTRPDPVRPRAQVIFEVWRELPGVAALSGGHGGPLTRTVKLILDPLVIRPVRYPLCAGPMVTPEGQRLLVALIRDAAEVLRRTADWFALFKRVRRELRITDGHPQDRYFQRCYELAVTTGGPEDVDGRAMVAEALRELHEAPAGRTTEALRKYLADPARAAALTARLAEGWAARSSRPSADPDHTAAITTVLDECPRAGHGPDRVATELARLAGDEVGTVAGQALWWSDPALGAGPEPAAELGLTAHAVPVVPELGADRAEGGSPPPFDRSIQRRVFTTLRTSVDRAALAPIPDLVTDELERACAPWALAEESTRVAATVGARLALGLRPHGLGADDRDPAGRSSTTAAHRLISGRWRREAYVLRARRLDLDPNAEPTHDPLHHIAEQLRRPWQPYLRRLWARLHGRDVRGEPITGGRELWDLLDGVALSVIRDHRDRIRRALSVRGGTDSPAEATTR